MERLRELLDLWENAESRANMTPEELRELEQLLVERADEIAAEVGEDGRPTDEQVQELAEISVTLNGADDDEDDAGVRGAIQAADDAAEEDRARASDLLTQIRGAEDDGGEGGDGEGGEQTEPAAEGGEGGDGGEGDAGDGGTGGDGGDGDEAGAGDGGEGGEPGGEQAEGEQTEPVAASTTPAQRRARGTSTRIGRVAARRPERVRPQASGAGNPQYALVASANIQNAGIHAGDVLDTPEAIGAAFIAAWDASQGFAGGRQKVSVCHAGGRLVRDVYPEDRILTADAASNQAKLDRVTSAPVVAAGGRCVPSVVRYDLPTLNGTDATPVSDDMMVRFGMDRGGVITLAPPVLSDIVTGNVEGSAVSVWSEANDIDPGSDGLAVKPCMSVDCPDDSESIVDAIVSCLKFGNWRSRFFGEQVQAIIDLAATAHARFMEVRRLTDIGDGSTQVTTGQVLGVTRDVISALRRGSAAIRNHHRLPTNFPLRFGFPDWLFDMMAVDLARQMPVGTLDETLAVAEAQILRWLAVDNINPTAFLDGEPGQIMGPQGDGPLNGWPDKVVSYLYPEGTWLDGDGGMLDLGIMRDTVNTGTNEFQIFSESWQATHFFGVESWRIEMDVCPDGSAAALAEIDPCGVGS